MAYSDDISGLGADHHWKFDGNSNDAIGSANGTDTSVLHTASAIAEDATNCMSQNGRTDRVSIPTTTTINNAAHARKAVGGWFMVSGTELPHVRIYGEGNNVTNFQMVLFAGNSVMLEVRDSTTWQIQIYSDIALAADRPYHLMGILEGSGYGDEIRFYIDGVEQTQADPASRAPGDASLAARGVAEFGDPAGTVGMNGVALVMNSPGDNSAANQIITGYWQHWCVWGDEADAVLTETEVRETLFEKGALPDITISTGTESAMQTALDAYADTLRSDAPLCIRIEPVSGGGDFELIADNITFDSLASIHVQYTGTDTLTWKNSAGSDASIFSTPSGGTVTVVNENTLTVSGLQNPTEVRIYDAGTTTEIDGTESVTTGSVSYDLYENSVDIHLVSLAYEIQRLEAIDTSADITLQIEQFADRQYENA